MGKDFYLMQQEAIKRVRDMQKKAEETVREKPVNSEQAKNQQNKIKNLIDLSKFKGNKDDILIIALIILLSEEGADILLILALLYVVL